MLRKRWWICCLAASLCLGLAAGCGGERDKGVNSGKDRPVPPTAFTTKSG
jgi:hypothetical protein